jgi:predicted O-linked N-acetylglucosamine transferase (SPINDLY family)
MSATIIYDLATMPPVTIEQAIQLHQSGRLGEAERAYRELLAADPDHAAATHFLGLIAHQVGQHQPAIELMRRSIELNPNSADFHNNLAHVYQALGQWDAAIESFERAAALNPQSPEALNNLGNALRFAGRLDDAERELRRALALQPRSVPARTNLGFVLHQRGQLADAVTCYREALASDPQYVPALHGMGLALRDAGRLPEAESFQRDAARLAPQMPEIHNNLGVTLCALGKQSEAIASFARAIELVPDAAAFHNNLANALRDAGRAEEAADAARRAVELAPDLAEPHNNLATCLFRVGEVAAAAEQFRESIRLRPDESAIPGSNLLFALHHDPDVTEQALFDEHLQWARRHAPKLARLRQEHANDRTPDRPLRIGYVSPDFRNHSVGQFFAPVLPNHDRARFRVYCYSNVAAPDAITARMRAQAHEWREIRGRSDADVVEIVRADQIDILIDLAVHGADNRLPVFAAKPAPVQITYLGYPGTTGLDAVDYKITDARIDPPGRSEQFHTERLLRLAGCYFCYPPPVQSPDIIEPPALKSGHVTFASFNNFTKVNHRVLGLWARVLAAVPASRLLLAFGVARAPKFEDRVLEIFAREGVAADRLEFSPPVPFPEYLGKHNDVDVVLDPFPFNGGTTTCHALWMGVPIITLARGHGVSRMGESFLRNVNLPELLAPDEEQYIHIAARLAEDIDELASLRKSMRDRMRTSPIMNIAEHVRDLESLYRQAWAEFCKG